MNNISDIRSAFIDYFCKNNHTEIASSSLVPETDASLLFTNSGMVQFKNIFTGKENPKYLRAVTSQKCLRAGGKHNDLENVGYTARHHTFFEMLGNFSFGDYFKEQAIYYAWDFLTNELGIDKRRLLVTVYHNDEDTINIWKKIAGLTNDKIIRISTIDNFWQMGDKGPCGPCSEIFYDHGENVTGGMPGTKDEDGDRYVEIWNLVFMQYLLFDGGKRKELPKPSIDTGMGLERIAAVLQGKYDNYETDLMESLVASVKDITNTTKHNQSFTSHKVIADHIRAICFLLAEGILPSNEGRGYVCRRIMRRAMRHTYLLGVREPVLYKLVGSVSSLMGDHYKELQRAESTTSDTLKYEEIRFGKTLQKGMKYLDEACNSVGANNVLSGEVVFKLYDTYGFPVDVTEDVIKERNITLNIKSFDSYMKQQKTLARKSWKGTGELENNNVWFDIQNKFGSTEYLGYKNAVATASVLAIIKGDKEINKIQSSDIVDVIFSQSPFYAESGGQVGDSGIATSDFCSLEVIDCKKVLGKIFSHRCIIKKGILSTGTNMQLSVNSKAHKNISSHHTLTHILHSVLQKELGSHVVQRGSLVFDKGLRFDFSHPNALSENEIIKIENSINNIIRKNLLVSTRLMDKDTAINQGAMALFGQTYGDEVRVVSISINDLNENVSVELCGGTHVTRTGEIGTAVITNETAVASGVRRIEMVSGDSLNYYLRKKLNVVSKNQELLRCNDEKQYDALLTIVNERNTLRDKVSSLKIKIALSKKNNLDENKVKMSFSNYENDEAVIASIPVSIRTVIDFPAKELKPLVDNLKNKQKSGIIILSSKDNNKVSLLVSVSNDLVDKGIDARVLVNEAAEVFNSKAGGRATLAQTGGSEVGKLTTAITSIVDYINNNSAKN